MTAGHNQKTAALKDAACHRLDVDVGGGAKRGSDRRACRLALRAVGRAVKGSLLIVSSNRGGKHFDALVGGAGVFPSD
jgi:hypothetical protein